MKTLSFQNLSLFKAQPYLQSEIFCIEDVIVACSYAVSNSGQVNTYEQREKPTRKLL